MNQDPSCDLETRLCQDAERVLEAQTAPAPIAKLLERHHYRKRRKTLARSVGLSLLALVIPAAWVASVSIQPPVSEVVSVDKAPESPRVEGLVEPPSFVPASNQIIETGTTQASSDIVPIVLVQTNVNGEQIFIPGLYVPARSESIDSSQLSQAEQRAVREVLGLKNIPKTQQPI